jgi:hypothetical protein
MILDNSGQGWNYWSYLGLLRTVSDLAPTGQPVKIATRLPDRVNFRVLSRLPGAIF